jgi:hypothetical protein
VLGHLEHVQRGTADFTVKRAEAVAILEGEPPALAWMQRGAAMDRYELVDDALRQLG